LSRLLAEDIPKNPEGAAQPASGHPGLMNDRRASSQCYVVAREHIALRRDVRGNELAH
jgi:hypothetical protein